MKKLITAFALLLSLLSQSYSRTVITYIPSYDSSSGYFSVKNLNQGIFLTSLQADSEIIDLVIPKGVYFLPNNQTINLHSLVNLSCDSVTFVYKWVDDEFRQNIIQFQDKSKAGISGLTIDFRQAYKDNKPTYANSVKFVGRSIIQIEHSDNIIIKGVTILKILGAGIELSNSNSCVVYNCNIQGSWVYGSASSTQGYSIDLVGALTKNNLIKGNVLRDSRHQVVLQYSCSENIIDSNNFYDTKSLKKVWFLEIFDREFTFNCVLHGNSAFKNIISNNYADHRISIDNVKDIPNGPGNQIINNTVDGLIDVQSKSPDFSYNEKQIIKGNKYKTLRIEARDCINENNTKIK